MKSLTKAIALAAVFAAPVASFAQAYHPITHAQIRAELILLGKAGYSPASGDDPHYPYDIQAAEARVAAQNGNAPVAADAGGVNGGVSASGLPDASTGTK